MKKPFFSLISAAILFLLAIAPAQAAISTTFTTGQDWVHHMSEREKFISIVLPISVFHQYGVPFRLSPDKYIRVIDNVLGANPQIENEDISNILASAVYLDEPESRPAFDAMETNFLRGDYRPADVQLTLRLDNETPDTTDSAD